ncbi:L,D-transpeptidase [Thermoleptolyngbya sp. M55_K2018_002]|uniref:L,D-transpeptidase n=1 Tax=Thermoleptolyngbya sp. M55_K2018_002 TaxID=2747808 RepID=UPI0019F8022A|nr:L,D-transpeptidase [Thermoleptolyngbya sp. M55_K2018_002]HIK40410.1 L,D-transpeptidase [Thermoleptolyngbya sp. M55_K2018_002]
MKLLTPAIASVLAFIPVFGMLTSDPQQNPASVQPSQRSPQGVRLVADVSDRALYLLKPAGTQQAYPAGFGPTTPFGQFQITSKIPNPTYQNPQTGEISKGVLGEWFLGFRNAPEGYYGIHEGDIHQPSNGCIRLNEFDLRAIAAQVTLGTPIEIRP